MSIFVREKTQHILYRGIKKLLLCEVTQHLALALFSSNLSGNRSKRNRNEFCAWDLQYAVTLRLQQHF